MGSAWATFIGYGLMMVFSYILGQKYYKIPYHLLKITGYLGFAIILYYVTVFFRPDTVILRVVFHTFLLLTYLAVAGFTEKRDLKDLFSS